MLKVLEEVVASLWPRLTVPVKAALDAAWGRTDAASLTALQSLNAGYLPWSEAAIQPLVAERMINDVIVNGRRRVVELGSGISTLLLAALSSETDLEIELTVVDESVEWLHYVREQVERISPRLSVDYIEASLREPAILDMPFNVERWYDIGLLESIEGNIDLLVCDGPTAYTSRTRYDRWPALPYFSERLSERCCVILDDTFRWGERKVLADWMERESGMRAVRSGRATFLLRGSAYNS